MPSPHDPSPAPLAPLAPAARPSPPPPPPAFPPRIPPRVDARSEPESSVGALWVAGLGAFLVIVGAATFVAVRWDEIPSTTKLGALVAVTLGCLGAHRLLRSSLPVTSVVLAHLGVLLTPVDVAAVGVGLRWSWPTMLLAVGAATAVVPSVARRADHSVILRAAGGVGVVLTAAGMAAVTGGPAGPLLAATALAAAALRRLDRQPEALAWALLAGLSLPLATVRLGDLAAADVLVDLGVAGPVPPVAALATGLLAGLTLALVGRRRDDVVLALAGVGSAMLGVATAWYRVDPGVGGPGDAAAVLAAVGAAALLAEVAAWTWRSDPFWSRVAGPLAILGEVGVAVVTYRLGGTLLDIPRLDDADPVAALAAGLAALTWLAAIARRPLGTPDHPVAGASGDRAGAPGALPQPFAPPTFVPRHPVPVPVDVVDVLGPALAALATAVSVALATASGPAAGVAGALAAAVVLLADPARTVGRAATRASGVAAAALMAGAPLLVSDVAGGRSDASWAWMAACVGTAGAFVVAAATVRMARSPRVRPDEVATSDLLFALLALAPVTAACGVLAAAVAPAPALVLAVLTGAGLAAVLDAVEARPGRWPVAMAPRLALAVPLAGALALRPAPTALLASLVALVFVVDAVRRQEPALLVGAGCATPVVAASVAVVAGAGVAGGGVAVTVSGLAWLVVGRLLPRGYAGPAVVNALVAAGCGLALAAGDQRLSATNLLLVGSAALVAGSLLGRRGLVAAGAAGVLPGLWLHLAAAGVAIAEPYVLPVAALALAGGFVARREGPLSSWLAYAPPVAILGGASLAERAGGGAAWHGLLAGTVGVVAVALGAHHRLIGPLLVGTALVLAVSAHETVAVTAQVPTWLWLCTGGAALLGAGVGMERRGLGPVDAGRRVVDVIRARYT
jgi:hypothetical protein